MKAIIVVGSEDARQAFISSLRAKVIALAGDFNTSYKLIEDGFSKLKALVNDEFVFIQQYSSGSVTPESISGADAVICALSDNNAKDAQLLQVLCSDKNQTMYHVYYNEKSDGHPLSFIEHILNDCKIAKNEVAKEVNKVEQKVESSEMLLSALSLFSKLALGNSLPAVIELPLKKLR